MRILRPGDPCPCCGLPIKTEDPLKLLFLSRLEGGLAIQSTAKNMRRGDDAELISPLHTREVDGNEH